MFKLLIILVLTSLLSARPQTEAEYEGYDVYGEYYDNYDYEDSYDSQVTIIILYSLHLHVGLSLGPGHWELPGRRQLQVPKTDFHHGECQHQSELSPRGERRSQPDDPPALQTEPETAVRQTDGLQPSTGPLQVRLRRHGRQRAGLQPAGDQRRGGRHWPVLGRPAGWKDSDGQVQRGPGHWIRGK